MEFKGSTCHPERPIQAKGLCRFCYMKQYDEARREKHNASKRKDPSEYSPNYRVLPRKPKSIPTCGHPDRRCVAWGKCNACYQAARRSGEIVVGMAQCHPELPALAKGLCHDCYGKKRYWDDPEKAREIANRSHRDSAAILRDQLIEAYGGKCACPKCPEANQAFLTLEHVNGDGKSHRAEMGSHTYADLRRRGFPQDGYTLLCMNCNHGSRYTGACPHMIEE
jgi:hypothetical protein